MRFDHKGFPMCSFPSDLHVFVFSVLKMSTCPRKQKLRMRAVCPTAKVARECVIIPVRLWSTGLAHFKHVEPGFKGQITISLSVRVTYAS